MICAYCQAPIEGPPYRPCRSCASPYHIDCWAEYGGCSIAGCAEAPQTDSEPLPVPAAAPATPAATQALQPPRPSRTASAPPPAPIWPAPAPAPVPPTPAPSPVAVPSGPAEEPEALHQGRARAPAPPPPPPAQRGGPWRWQRPALTATVAVLLIGTGLVIRPLLDPMPAADAPASTVPVTTSPTTVATSDDPTDTGGGLSSGAVDRAIATVADEGYTVDPDERRIGGTLSVFIGIATDSATAYNQKAFFFVGPELRYIGTDTSNPSRGIRVSWNTSETVALEYQLYRAEDANCCPSGGTAEVRYQWDGIRLTPMDEIPAEYGEGALSR